MVPIVRPIAGVAFRAPFGLGFGAVYRHEAYTAVNVDIDIRVWNGERYIEETGELIGCEHFMARRAATPELGRGIISRPPDKSNGSD